MSNNFSNTETGEMHVENPGFKKPGLLQTGTVFSLCVILFLWVGSRVQRREFYSGILITEFILILLPPLFLLFFYKYDIRKVLRLNPVRPLHLLMVFLMMLFALPLVGVVNVANLWIIRQLFGRVVVSQPPVAHDSISLLLNILVIAGAAGLCEEVLFRGVVMRGMERFGIGKALIISSLLFGMMHADIHKLLGTFLLGLLIGFIVYRTQSIFAGMFAHFTNNAVAVCLTYALEKLRTSMGVRSSAEMNADQIFSMFSDMPPIQIISVLIFWGLIILFCAFSFGGLIFALIKTTLGYQERIIREPQQGIPWGLAAFLPGFSILSFIYIVQGMRLKGLAIGPLEIILKIIGLK